MAKLGVFPIPGEFKSEDKWFRYFNRKQAAVLVLCGILDYKIIMMGIVMVRLPVDVLFLNGGGITIDQLLFRLLYRRLHRELYTKNEDGGGDSL